MTDVEQMIMRQEGTGPRGAQGQFLPYPDSEQWKIVDRFPLYEVSSHGRVRSLSRSFLRMSSHCATPHTVTTHPRILNGYLRQFGRRNVCLIMTLRKDGRPHYERVHRLVLEAFRGMCPQGQEGCHNDGHPEHNHINNLRWDTHASNMDDMYTHGTKTKPPVHHGDSHHNARITAHEVQDIRRHVYRRGLFTELSKRYSISATSVARIHAGIQRVQSL